ncbi:bacC [Symbiodinium sp. CCMP2592]|nr:bacC [Symbiodinium sp. CCMP2592]
MQKFKQAMQRHGAGGLGPCQNSFPNLAEWNIADFQWKARARIFANAVNQDASALSPSPVQSGVITPRKEGAPAGPLTTATRGKHFQAAGLEVFPTLLRAGKSLPNKQGVNQGSILGAVAGAHILCAVAPAYGIPALIHTGYCGKQLRFVERLRGMSESSVQLFKSPYFWAVMEREVFPALIRGGFVASGHKSPQYMAQAVEKFHVDVLMIPPSLLDSLLDVAQGFLRGRRVITTVGEPLTLQLANCVAGHCGLSVALRNFYDAAAAIPVPAQAMSGHGSNLNNSHVAGTVNMIPEHGVDTDLYPRLIMAEGSFEMMSPGEAGEICFGGVLAARDCLRPELTAAKFAPTENFGRIYRTGDLGRFREGALEVVQISSSVLSRSRSVQGSLRGRRVITTVGEPLTLQLANPVAGNLLGHRGLSVTLRNFYGTVYTVPEHGVGTSLRPRYVPERELRFIMALGSFELMPPGKAGEICFGEENLGQIYRTGDLGRFREGALEVVGRLGRQPKVNDVRVEPGEIEIEVSMEAAGEAMVPVEVAEAGEIGPDLPTAVSIESMQQRQAELELQLLEERQKAKEWEDKYTALLDTYEAAIRVFAETVL